MTSFLLDFRIALRSLFRHRRRTIFLMTAIAGVTGLMVLLDALSTGISETMIRSATTLSSGHVNVGGFFKATANQGGPVVTEFAKVVEVVERNVPEMQHWVQRGRGWAKIVSDSGSIQAGVTGIDIANEPDFKRIVELSSGKIEDLAQPNTMLVFESQVEHLKVKIGDAVTLSAQTNQGAANTVDCRIVAIAKDMGLLSKFGTFVPVATTRSLYQLRPDTTGVIQLYLKPEYLRHEESIAARLRKTLEDAGYRVMDPEANPFWMKFQAVNREDWTGQKLDVTTWEDEAAFLTKTLMIVDGLRFVLLVILLAIVIIGIMNTMWIAIRERTREIGTLRAIGMQRWGVLRMFLLECFQLGVLGTCAGAAIGAGVAALINLAGIAVPLSVQLFLMSDRLHLAVHGTALVQAGLAITLVTTLAALYPAYRAARLPPVSAMSHFG
ncbi:MAG: FtsX-like permease family protein [Polyangia bacterium]|jgi:ABC-type lipoprotein release transport system permease subunit